LPSCPTGADFSAYKAALERRIARRMTIRRIRPSKSTRSIWRRPGRDEALYQDCLISVTSFFRDDDVFQALTGSPSALFTDRPRGHPHPVWVPGCASGEEATRSPSASWRPPVTADQPDVPDLARPAKGAQEGARRSLPRERRAARVAGAAAALLRKTDGHYQISKAIREMRLRPTI
jgi:two-component system CheB/CheR fusion protein